MESRVNTNVSGLLPFRKQRESVGHPLFAEDLPKGRSFAPLRMTAHIWILASLLAGVLSSHPALAQENSATANAATQHDGQHDFDFEVGSWKIHLKRLMHPLTGAHDWVEFDGTSVTQKVWDGRANLEQFETDSPTGGHIEGLTLRLYNPQSHQWSLYWGTSKSGALSLPATVGEFKNGKGEFYDQEDWHGRVIFVRYIWSDITPNSAHFEQSFSDDGGKTWEVSWITDQTRVKQ
ncbi:MAG TPA: hypothetical protein VHT24_12410 [Pseudacidobacterium sp.]|nr:hypothetical protein [Pseudacidobacterium sp.]